jgi:hypothetical protein
MFSMEVCAFGSDLAEDDWRKEIVDYLENPSRKVSRKLRYKAIKFVLLDGVDAKSAPRAKHTASQTSWLNTRADSKACQSIFLKFVRCQSLELAGWYQTVPYLRLKAM